MNRSLLPNNQKPNKDRIWSSLEALCLNQNRPPKNRNNSQKMTLKRVQCLRTCPKYLLVLLSSSHLHAERDRRKSKSDSKNGTCHHRYLFLQTEDQHNHVRLFFPQRWRLIGLKRKGQKRPNFNSRNNVWCFFLWFTISFFFYRGRERVQRIRGRTVQRVE